MATSAESIEQREELHRSIVRTSPNAIFLVDAATRRVLDVNPATCDLLGYTREELLDERLEAFDLVAHGDHDDLVERIRRQHHDILGDRVFRRADGRLVPVEASVNLVIYRGQEVWCFFARDISDRIAAERESERLHRALTLSQKHEAVGRLAAGIAHDFNNQLMVMLLSAQFVSQRLDAGDPNQEELSEIVSAGNSASALIRQLLAFSGKQLMRPSLVEFDRTLRQRERMLRRALGEDVDFVARYEAGSATVYADSTQLDQVVLNLAVNARDAMPEGGRFTLTTSVVELGEDFVGDYATLRAGPHVLLKVTDSGVGMDEATLGRIFEPFFTTKAAGRGTGLGLATAYGIVKQSGGSIWASSEPGAGTTFRVYLPISEQAPGEAEHLEPVETSDVPRGDETILVVDDEEMVRVLASRILRDLGYTVLEAAGPREALEYYLDEQGQPRMGIDLVLTDVVMPEESGPDMIRAFKDHRPGLKVIFMSGYSYGRIRTEDLFSNEYLFVEKPLGRAELAHAVRRTLDTVADAP